LIVNPFGILPPARLDLEQSVLALWLRHESIETMQIYLGANLELKQWILDAVTPLNGKPGRYRPDDKLLAFLKDL
jgi:hypothetical protein